MTDEQKYTELLKDLAELLKWKNDTIKIQEFQISDLKASLEKAEKEIAMLKGKKCESGVKK